MFIFSKLYLLYSNNNRKLYKLKNKRFLLKMDLSSKVNGLTRRDLLNLVKGMGALAFLNTFEPFISLASAEEDLELKIESVKEIQMPTPRKNHGAVVLRDRLYIAGGLDDNNKPNPQVLHTRIKNGEIIYVR